MQACKLQEPYTHSPSITLHVVPCTLFGLWADVGGLQKRTRLIRTLGATDQTREGSCNFLTISRFSASTPLLPYMAWFLQTLADAHARIYNHINRECHRHIYANMCYVLCAMCHHRCMYGLNAWSLRRKHKLFQFRHTSMCSCCNMHVVVKHATQLAT